MLQSYPGPTAGLLLLLSSMDRNASEFLEKDTLEIKKNDRSDSLTYLCVDGFIILLNIVRLAGDDESYSVFIPLLV